MVLPYVNQIMVSLFIRNTHFGGEENVCNIMSIAHVFTRRYSTLSRALTHLKSTGEQLTGHSDVLQAQKFVQEKKEDLRSLRHELSEAVIAYEDLQKKLKGLYARKTQVYQEQQRDIATLQAINNEEETLLYNEQTLHTKVEELKQKERECFESLSDGIQLSHEKERAQSDRLKYYSRLGSILGAFFGFLSSSFFLKREIRRHNLIQAEKMENIEKTLVQLDKDSNDPLLLAKKKGLDLEKFVEKVQEKFETTEAAVSRLHSEVEKSSTLLHELTAAQNKLILSLHPQSDATRPQTDQPSITDKVQALTNTNVLLGFVAYSIGLALYSLL